MSEWVLIVMTFAWMVTAFVSMRIAVHARRQLREIRDHLEINAKKWEEVEAMQKVLMPCPVCGERGGYVPDYATAARH